MEEAVKLYVASPHLSVKRVTMIKNSTMTGCKDPPSILGYKSSLSREDRMRTEEQ